ncbi:cysteine hydrolase family protein [Prauserella halophila]|uniref:Cysteine hydrolase family protein n=1 Tax=Prauserella halophila TaxID=185641 RepID=A0ABP4GFT7_9PSEU|nr:isochorismatase family protein [Prauserella halophila]MCP2234522.1 Nicotinamidase-related amidase [Prauserella halophila]
MTVLDGRPHTALMVVDVQNAVVDEAYRRDAVVATIGALVDRARRAGVPVVWVRHADEELVEGSPGWQIVPELQPAGGEAVVGKNYGDAFEDTDLESVLAARGAGTLVVTGAETDACIRSTLHGAFTRGYDVTLVGDAHTAGDRSVWGVPPPEAVIAHTNLYWSFHAAPGRTATTVPAAQVTFG